MCKDGYAMMNVQSWMRDDECAKLATRRWMCKDGWGEEGRNQVLGTGDFAEARVGTFRWDEINEEEGPAKGHRWLLRVGEIEGLVEGGTRVTERGRASQLRIGWPPPSGGPKI